jgi:two-component system sensor histidine kinase DegS
MDRDAERAKTGRAEALDIARSELEQQNAELRDISNKISTSRGQVEQLAQRNAKLIGEIRRIEASLDQVPRLKIRETYSESLDVQQRLLTTRAQLERLQAEETDAKHQAGVLQRLIDALNRVDDSAADGEQFNAREMLIRVIDAQEEQSERLARLMHDGPAHSLTNFILQAEIVQKLFDKDPEKAHDELNNLKQAANDAFQRVRSFIFDLRPMMLTDLGLVPTLKRYLEAFTDKTGIETTFNLVGRERRIEHYREVLLFRGIQALIQNARDHSAASAVTVTLDMAGQDIAAIVEDDGRGFATGQLRLDNSDASGIGLGALQERVNLVGGNVTVDSAPGQGARIEIVVPAGPEM